MAWFPIILKINSKALTIASKTLPAKHNLERGSHILVFNCGGGGTMMTKALNLSKLDPRPHIPMSWPWLFSSLASWYSQSNLLHYTHSDPSSRSLNVVGSPLHGLHIYCFPIWNVLPRILYPKPSNHYSSFRSQLINKDSLLQKNTVFFLSGTWHNYFYRYVFDNSPCYKVKRKRAMSVLGKTGV